MVTNNATFCEMGSTIGRLPSLRVPQFCRYYFDLFAEKMINFGPLMIVTSVWHTSSQVPTVSESLFMQKLLVLSFLKSSDKFTAIKDLDGRKWMVGIRSCCWDTPHSVQLKIRFLRRSSYLLLQVSTTFVKERSDRADDRCIALKICVKFES